MGATQEGSRSLMEYKIAALGGDGVGPEVVAQAIKVIRAAGERHGHTIDIREGLIGRSAYYNVGSGFPDETRKLCETSDAVLFGATGGPPEEEIPPSAGGLINLRQDFGCACNFRPIKLYPPLIGIGPIKPEAKSKGVDFVVVREIGARGAYGPGGTETAADGLRQGVGRFSYTEAEVERAVRPAFELARSRRKRIHLVGYWGLNGFGAIWRAVFDEIGEQYADVERLYMLPDNCNMMVARDPWQFDVIVFDDLFRAGMVVDLGALLAGSLGMAASAEMRPHIGDDGRVMPSLKRVFGLYEPSHGTVDHRAGKDQVNPIATILSAVAMFRYSLDLPEVADAVEEAIVAVIGAGYRTYDIMESGTTLVSCSEMGDRIAAQVASGNR